MNWPFLILIIVSIIISVLMIYFVPVIFAVLCLLGAVLLCMDVIYSFFEDEGDM